MKYRYTKQGVHLFDRSTGTNILMDEFECSDDILSVAPANVSIALTNKCNRLCKHCFAPKVEAMLNSATVCDWIAELNDNGCLGVGFGGGEPLLYDRIKDLCRYVHDNTSMACTLTTNGDFIDGLALEWIGDYVNFLRMSTNGLPLNYGNIARVSSRVSLGINYLLNTATLPDLYEVAVQCMDSGVKEILVLPQVPTSGCVGIDNGIITKLDETLLKWNLPIRVTVSALCADDMKSTVAIPGDSGVRQYLHISADGMLKKSSLEKGGIKIADSGIIPAIKEVYSNEDLDRI